MQTVCDPFLGWTSIDERDFLVRQLADDKASVEPTDLKGDALKEYGLVCGKILAKGHARTGDAVEISGYCGTANELDKAIAKFAFAYAEQTARDHEGWVPACSESDLPNQITRAAMAQRGLSLRRSPRRCPSPSGASVCNRIPCSDTSTPLAG